MNAILVVVLFGAMLLGAYGLAQWSGTFELDTRLVRCCEPTWRLSPGWIFIPGLLASTAWALRESGLRRWEILAALSGTGIALFGYFVVRRRIHMRLLAFVQENRYRVCPRCFFLLVGSPRDGTCPECGAVYSAIDLERDWKFLFRNLNKRRPGIVRNK